MTSIYGPPPKPKKLRPPAMPSSLKSAPKLPKPSVKQSAALQGSSKVLSKSGIIKHEGGETSSMEIELQKGTSKPKPRPKVADKRSGR